MTPRDGSVTVMVPWLTRISENESSRALAPGLSVRASVASRFDQFERPSGSTFTVMRGRVSDTSAGSIRPISSGQQLQLGGQPVGGERGLARALVAQHDVGEAHHRGRKQRDRDLAADRRLKPGDGADFRDDGVAHGRRGNERRGRHQCGDAGREDGRNHKA